MASARSGSKEINWILLAAFAIFALAWPTMAKANPANCRKTGDETEFLPKNGVAPNRYDYRQEFWHPIERQSREWLLANVEENHFPPKTEMLIRPKFSRYIDDLTYTLNIWPNHHRVLNTALKLSERLGTDYPEGSGTSIECFFARAIRFRPKDTVVRGLYAEFLRKRNRQAEAVTQLVEMDSQASGNAMTHLNIGLLYLEMNRPQEALEQAHKAMANGLSDTGMLRERLTAAGAWRDAPPDLSRENGGRESQPSPR